MKKSTIVVLAMALAAGAGTALAQPGTSSPVGSPSQLPRDSGGSKGTMNPPTTVAPGTTATPGTTSGASPQAPVPGAIQPPMKQPSTAQPSTMTRPSMANNPPAGAMPGSGAPGEARARAKIEADGYKNAGQLTRGPDGKWHGMAMRGSTSVQVMVDTRGNVTSQ